MHRLRAISVLLLGTVLVPVISLAEIGFWGYTGIAGPHGSYLDEVLAAGIPVNNLCLSLSDIETAARAVRSHFPGIPTVMGYGFDGSMGQPAPAYIPAAIDWVGFFKYGYFDPANPVHPCNADAGYLTAFLLRPRSLKSHPNAATGT